MRRNIREVFREGRENCLTQAVFRVENIWLKRVEQPPFVDALVFTATTPKARMLGLPEDQV